MKLMIPLVVAFSVMCTQAKPLDEMIAFIAESDLAGFNGCRYQNTFSVEELVALKNLNESVLDKRKKGWSLNHKKAMLDGYQELLLSGMCLGIGGRQLVKDFLGKKGLLEAPKSGEFYMVQVVSSILAFVGLYCTIKFVISNLRKREKFELLYKDAILINTALELMINNATHNNQASLSA